MNALAAAKLYSRRLQPKSKPVHRAKLIREDGAVSPLCARTPRAISLKQATWTIRDEDVTCKGCLEIIRTRTVANG